MKKYLLSFALVLGFITNGFTQDISENAIGLRFASNHGIGSEISYQRKLNRTNRIEGDLGWSNNNDFNALKITGIYQWVWNIEDNFNWYAGVGAGFENWSSDKSNNGTFLFASGDVGIEYSFSIPLLLSLDFRPEVGGNDYYNDNFNSNVALSLKYQF